MSFLMNILINLKLVCVYAQQITSITSGYIYIHYIKVFKYNSSSKAEKNSMLVCHKTVAVYSLQKRLDVRTCYMHLYTFLAVLETHSVSQTQGRAI